jgi:YegS/Rv2252/BmrU family lipid kinase
VEKTWIIIVNPHAGGNKGGLDFPAIEKIIQSRNFDYEILYTSKRRHAMVLTREMVRKGYRKFIAVGGDGTVNEVVNGLMADPSLVAETVLGVIMIGTGNDWGKMFDIPTSYSAAIDVIEAHKTFQQDVGKVCFYLGDRQYTRYFINMAGLGFDAKVAEKVNEQKRQGKSSQFSYLSALFRTLVKYKPLDINISIEGRPMRNNRLFTMSIGICKYSGGGMMQVPDAIADDGLFDVMIVGNIRKTKIVRKIKKLYDGSIGSLKEVGMHRAKSLDIDASGEVMLEVDGESLGHGPFEFSIAEQKLKIIVGK